MTVAFAPVLALAAIPAAGPVVPPQVAAAARLVAADGARPPSLRRPLRGLRRERFARGWVWIVDSGRMDDPSLCGTGGCVVQLWMPRPGGGVVRRFAGRVVAYRIVGQGSPRPVLRTECHGSRCGGSGDMPCVVRHRWRPDPDRPPGAFGKGIVTAS